MALNMLRRLGRKVATRIADRVAKNELFEKHGERQRQAPLERMPAQTPSVSSPAEEAVDEEESSPGLVGCVPMDVAELKALLGPSSRTRIVNHWATWCDPCIEELPHLIALHRALGSSVEMLGISWDLFEGGVLKGAAQKVEAFSEGQGLTWGSALVTAPPEVFFGALDIDWQRIPQTWIIAPDGTITRRIEGLIDAEMAAALAEELRA